MSKFHHLTAKQITETEVLKVIRENIQKRNFVITPISILGLTGFPIAEQNEILNAKDKIQKIKEILIDLETKEILKKRKSKQDFKGIKEIAYDFVEKAYL